MPVARIDEEDWSAMDVDVKGAAFEGLLEKAASEGKKGAGQYFTPRPLIQTICRVMKPDPRGNPDFRLCDPACGTGGLPGVTIPAVVTAAVAYCQKRRAFLILDSPAIVKTPDQMRQAVANGVFPQTSNAAVYYPWVVIPDQQNHGQARITSPGGTIAGVFATTDASRGLWKAPAGIGACLVGVEGLEDTLTDADNGRLSPLGVNCLRTFPAEGNVVWGARTLAGTDQTPSDWKYIPVRRLGLFIEESLYRGTQWAVFEPNAEPLWAALRLNISVFMQELFRQGAFQGATPQEAFFVKCDADTTTQVDIENGVLNILIGFAPLMPAEFVVLKITQLAGQTTP